MIFQAGMIGWQNYTLVWRLFFTSCNLSLDNMEFWIFIMMIMICVVDCYRSFSFLYQSLISLFPPTFCVYIFIFQVMQVFPSFCAAQYFIRTNTYGPRLPTIWIMVYPRLLIRGLAFHLSAKSIPTCYDPF